MHEGPMPEDSPIPVRALLSEAFAERESTDFLFRPNDIVLAGDTAVVLDTGNDRLLFLDTSLHVIQTVGRTGAGPGEFAAPNVARVARDEIFVSEINNGRFTVLDRGGNFRRTFGQAILALSFAVGSDGTVYRPARSTTDHIWRINDESEALFAPRRDTATGDEATAILRAKREPWVALTPGDTIHVFDDTNGTISKYDSRGRYLGRRALPKALLDSLNDKRRSFAKALQGFGVNEFGVPLIKSFAVTAEGEILIVLATGTTVAAVVDPQTYRIRRITVPSPDGPWTLLRNARSMALRGDRLWVLSGDQLLLYGVDRGSG